MLLSIIIVSYNTADLTLQTLESVVHEIKNSPLLKNNSEIWVVDNNSSDSTISELKKFQNQTPVTFHVIQNSENLGFAKANNQAITQASGEYIFLLNSDTVLKPKALEYLITIFQNQPQDASTSVLTSHKNELDHLGILSAQLLNSDGSIQKQGGSFPSLLALASHMWLLDDVPLLGRFLPSTQHTGHHDQSTSQQKVKLQDWVGGTAMMIKREVLSEVGNFDENIFMYGEDVELCLRASHHHWDSAINTQALVTHLGSASSSSKNAIVGELKGYLYIWSKHFPLWQLPLVRAILKLGCILRILVFGTILRESPKAQIYQEALAAL